VLFGPAPGQPAELIGDRPRGSGGIVAQHPSQVGYLKVPIEKPLSAVAGRVGSHQRRRSDAYENGGDDMATKADFTEAEWQTLQWAVTDTMTYLSLADPGFWDMFKEASGAAKYIAGVKASSENLLVHQLADGIKTHRDKAVSANPADISQAVTSRVGEAVKIVSGKAPEDLEAFKGFIIGVARATAEAAKGTGPTEAAAIAKLEAALG
jgi:hypothetical protein